MKLEIHDTYTDIFPTRPEVDALCTPGQGASTCVWLVMAGRGFQCTYYNKPSGLVDRYQDGLTNAKRNGCYAVKTLPIFGTDSRDIDILETMALEEGTDATTHNLH